MAAVIGVTFCVVGGRVFLHMHAEAERKRDDAARREYARVAERLDAEKAKRDASGHLQAAQKRLAGSVTATPEARLAAYREFTAALNEAKSGGQPTGLDDLKGLLNALELADRQVAEAERAQALPDVPEKPTYEKPEYEGTFHLSGSYRGRYKGGGIIVQRGQDYFIVENADPPSTPYVSGYVERTGGMEILAIGRDGRSADAVKLSDRESYEDDQRAYREEVANAKAEYQRASKEYEDAVRRRKDAERQAVARGRGEGASVGALRFQRDQQLVTLAQALAPPEVVHATLPRKLSAEDLIAGVMRLVADDELAAVFKKSTDAARRQAAFAVASSKSKRLEGEGRAAELVAILGANGHVVARDANINALYDEDLKGLSPAVGKALAGDAASGDALLDGTRYAVAVAPIRGRGSAVLGALLVGYRAK